MIRWVAVAVLAASCSSNETCGISTVIAAELGTAGFEYCGNAFLD